MRRKFAAIALQMASLVLVGASVAQVAPAPQASAPAQQAPTIAAALASGVLIVISKASQRMDVFNHGQPWLVSPVSTGRRGHSTPAGVFPILEKQRFHRSNRYSNAPMPFMQRLTMRGIAIHAGYVPPHPASHGCIRVPYAVARQLFGVTRAHETLVVITNAAVASDEQARALALATPWTQVPVAVPVAPVRVAQLAPVPRPGQTIQLAAATSAQEAEAHWARLIGHNAELARLDKRVIPVMVGSQRFFRLRASGPDAFATCQRLQSAGLACFKVL